MVQLEVLVGVKLVRPAACAAELVGAKAAERDRVHVLSRRVRPRWSPESRVPDAEARAERRRQRAAPGALGRDGDPAADVRCTLLVQGADAGGDVAVRHLAVRVEANHDLASRGGEPAIQRGRGRPLGVVQNGCTGAPRTFGRLVVRPAVDDEQLQPAFDVLAQDRTNACLYVPRLVAGGHQDCHERVSRSGGAPGGQREERDRGFGVVVEVPVVSAAEAHQVRPAGIGELL